MLDVSNAITISLLSRFTVNGSDLVIANSKRFRGGSVSVINFVVMVAGTLLGSFKPAEFAIFEFATSIMILSGLGSS